MLIRVLGCPAKCTSCQIPNFNVASTIDQVQCTGCLPGFVLSKGKCIESCPSGTFLDPKDNVTCSGWSIPLHIDRQMLKAFLSPQPATRHAGHVRDQLHSVSPVPTINYPLKANALHRALPTASPPPDPVFLATQTAQHAPAPPSTNVQVALQTDPF